MEASTNEQIIPIHEPTLNEPTQSYTSRLNAKNLPFAS